MKKVKKCSIKKRLVLFLIVLSSFQGLFSQVDKIFPASPEASALAEYVNIPVSLYTGVPQINLPLMSLEGKEMIIPVSISYHAAGNKVNDIASNVGLGWTLNAGGAITRVVRGKPDNYNSEYMTIDSSGPVEWSNDSMNHFIFNSKDFEPDVYYFNFLGNTGRFVIKNSGGVVITSANKDLKITISNTLENFTIVDEKGYVYNFGTSPDQREKSKSTTDTGFDTGEYVSSWYLSSIDCPYGEEILFEYKRSSLDTEYTIKSGQITNYDYTVYFTDQFGTFFLDRPGTTASDSFGGESVTTVKTIEPLVLEKITSKFENINYGFININSNTSRTDFTNGHKILSLELKDSHNQLIKKMKFNTDYFESSNNCSELGCKRLKLLGIDEIPKTDDENNKIKKYRFGYYETANGYSDALKLPLRNSPKIDHWGYFNNSVATGIIDVANRDPNELGTKSWVLTDITYPTGGIKKIEYALNDYGELNTKTGGLRVTKIQDLGTDITPITKTFSYAKQNSGTSSGLQYNSPIYSHIITSEFENPDDHPDFRLTHQFISAVKSYRAMNELFDLNGSNIGYSEVTVNNPDGSKEINVFTDLENRNDEFIDSNYYFGYIRIKNGQQFLFHFENFRNKNSVPHTPPTIRNSYQRGLLLNKTIKNDVGNKVYELINTYNHVNPNLIEYAYGYKHYNTYGRTLYQPSNNSAAPEDELYGYNIGIYTESNKGYNLEKSIERTFDLAGGDEDYLEKVVDYEYSDKKSTFIKSEQTTLSDGDILKTEYTYPFDLTGSINTTLTAQNKISDFIEKRDFINGTQLNLEQRICEFNTPHYTIPAITGGTPVLKKMNYQKKDLPVYDDVIIDAYDDKGNVIAYHDNYPVYILWGYGGKYPIAKIEFQTDKILEADLDQGGIPTTLFTDIQSKSDADDDTCRESTCKEELLRVALAKLRDTNEAPKLTNALITTYTYDPLVGMTSITDTRGETIYYYYDEFNRLDYVKDAYGKYLTKNEYHYKTQQ